MTDRQSDRLRRLEALDFSRVRIHSWHKYNNDWAMIGYHYVVRKSGIIERGRPEWAVGSHAYGENWHTLGIHVCGTFEGPIVPTTLQIEMTSMLIAYLCDKYGISIDRSHIVGHCELMSTDCPGKNLYNLLPILCGKANFYKYNT